MISESVLFASPPPIQFEPRAIRIGDQLAHARHMARNDWQINAETLLHHERNEEQGHREQGEHDHGDDQQRRDRPVHAKAFHPIGERRQHIGERDSGNERQQNLAEQPQQGADDEKRHEPEDDDGGRMVIAIVRSARLRPRGQLLRVRDSAAFMWRTHSAT